MSEQKLQYNNILETLVSIFTVERGELKILLIRKKNEPYKGYWILPGDFVPTIQTLEENINEAIIERTGLHNVYLEEYASFSELDRNPDARVVATAYIGLIDIASVKFKREDVTNIDSEWFPIANLPKLGYDHQLVIEKALAYLRTKLINSTFLKQLFPSDFTLPELQRVYEVILEQPLDRRNFRKKFLNLGIIEDTGDKNEGYSGRPAKLYRFKEDIKEINVF